MIQLGGAAVLCRAAADDPDACAPAERRGQLGLEMGLRLATHCLDRHTASGAGGAFEAGSMWECKCSSSLCVVGPSNEAAGQTSTTRASLTWTERAWSSRTLAMR